MPLVPEKLGARQEVRCAVCAQFWEQPVQSSKSSDGLARTLPCEPPPLSLTSPTGLNRTQELLAIQALGIPCMPAFDADGGGVVLDRVLGKVGGFGWWTALSARAKAQAMWKAHQGGAKAGDVLKDLNNYSLTARNRFSLGKNTAINTVVEVPNVHNAWHRLRGRDPHSTSDQATTSAPGDTADSSSQPPLTKGRVWAKHDTTHHELMASAAWGQEYLDSAASYCPVPLTLSMDVASKARADGMQYRAGVHQVYAAESEGVDSHARAASESAEPSGGPPAARPPLRSSLHFQGAVAVEGEAVLWKPKPKSPWASTPATPRGFPFSDRDGNRQASYNVDHGDAFQAQPYSDVSPAGPAQPDSNSSGDPASQPFSAQSSTGGGPSSSRRMPPGSSREGPAPASTAGGASGEDSGYEADSSSSGSGGSDSDLAVSRARLVAAATAGPAGPAQQQADARNRAPSTGRGSGSWEHRDTASKGLQAPGWLRLPWSGRQSIPNAGAVRAKHAEPRHKAQHVADLACTDLAGPGSASSLSGSLGGWLGGVGKNGSQSVQSSWGSDGLEDAEDKAESQEKPWWDQGPMLGNISADAVQSSIRGVTASAEGVRGELRAMTCHIQDGLLQQNPPAPKRRRWQPRRRPYSPWLASPYVKANASVGCLARIPLPHRAFRPLRFRRTPSGQNAGEAPPAAQEHSRFAKELWTPFLRGTALRLFSSTGISAQAGTFTRPLLDYSAASLRLDLGLTSPVVPSMVVTPHASPRAGKLKKTSSGASQSSHSRSGSSLPPASSSERELAARSSPADLMPKNRAFALEGRGIWHAISASFTQQLVGPLRGRVDLRFALDLPSVIAPEDIGGRRTWGAIINAVAAVRPSLLETVYGLDYIIPNTQGAARLAVWYAPMRKEAMLGMRLF